MTKLSYWQHYSIPLLIVSSLTINVWLLTKWRQLPLCFQSVSEEDLIGKLLHEWEIFYIKKQLIYNSNYTLLTLEFYA